MDWGKGLNFNTITYITNICHGYLSSCGCVSSTIWLHHLNFNKTLGECVVAWRILCGNVLMKWLYQLIDIYICTHLHTCYANMTIQHTYRINTSAGQHHLVQFTSGHHHVCTTNAPVGPQPILPTSANPTEKKLSEDNMRMHLNKS